MKKKPKVFEQQELFPRLVIFESAVSFWDEEICKQLTDKTYFSKFIEQTENNLIKTDSVSRIKIRKPKLKLNPQTNGASST